MVGLADVTAQSIHARGAMVMDPMAEARGLQLSAYGGRRVRLHDGSPADVLRSDGIRRASEPAGYATEQCLGAAVGLCYLPAGRAGAGGIPGINEHHRNTGQPGLVLDEGAKLMERPTMLNATLSLANRYPVTDALQIFEGDTAIGAFGLRE